MSAQAQPSEPAPRAIHRAWHATRRWLPRGGTLPADEWQARHRALLVFLWANVVGLTAFGVVTGHYSAGHSVLHVGSLLAFAVLGGSHRLGRTARTIAVSLGLLTAAALLVHMTNGLIEAHFYFFVVIVALTLYEDWRPFLVAVAYVLLHHGVIGMLDPHQVFNRKEEYAAPWKWAAIHALFVAGAGAAAVTAWRLNENVRERMRGAQAMLEEAAMMDSLTSLPNRRRLMADLEQVGDLEPANPVVLAIFDLNGFKAYNDTFGHAAGDSLLCRLGDRLHTATDGSARAYRLGGDEFCLLAPAAEVDVAALLERAADALSEQGEGFGIACSYGSALLPIDTNSSEEALRLADQRMYACKSNGRLSAGRQVGDALRRALEERDPELALHLGGVAVLSEAVAKRLDLDDQEIQRLCQAAGLHDIGKVAIPDAILLKPGPLNDGERAFIERHTIIGERIISTSPALAEVARLVRHSHERYDGSGYPDGISGEEIPLGSRIIGVCDAYDAMVSPRPYRLVPRTATEALDELRRCAGSQFDPRVVDAFAAALIAGRHATYPVAV